MTHHFFP